MRGKPVDAPTASIVVVTYDAPGDLLERCVSSLSRTATDAVTIAELVVVDNGGRAARRLEEAGLHDRVRVIDPGRNGGFAAGVNVGLAAALDRDVDLVVVLNDDVEVDGDWLAPLAGVVADDERIAAAQPVLVRRDDPTIVESAGVHVDDYGAGSDIGRGEPLDAVLPTVSAERDLDAVTGGAMLLRTSAVRDVGPFDERFFLYYEDTDWCARARSIGYRCVAVPHSVVFHVGSASTHRLGDSLRRLQERNRLWWTAMALPPSTFLRALWLSIRRVRHRPRRVHVHALLGGVAGAVPRFVARVIGRGRTRPRRWRDVEAVQPAATAAALESGASVRSSPPRRAARVLRRSSQGATSAPAFLRRPLTGVNVAGFHHVDNGLGDAVRTLTASLRAAGVDVVEVDNEATDAPRRFDPRPEPTQLHDTTIAVVTAVETPRFRELHPALFAGGRRVIGYWFWELDTVPVPHRHAFTLVDEVWTPTTFVQHAFDAAADARTLVRRAPIRLPSPVADEDAVARWRAEFGESVVFLTSFDYFSIPERKNPQAAISAFLAAFPDRSDVRLVVKTQNASFRPAFDEAVRDLAGDDDRVRFLDVHLDERDHLALLAAADVLVSPHRSEGLGLQPAQAMALGTAVVVTDYGGVTDYCTDDNSVPVGYRLVGVDDGEGIYPSGASWADIDHDELVAAMRRLADDEEHRGQLVAAGHRTIVGQPPPDRFGRAYLDLATTLDMRCRSARIS